MATDELKSIDITYSEQYAELLKTVTNVTKANCTILQHRDDKYRITIPNQALLTHIAAGPKDMCFAADRINVFSLTEFMKYSEAVNYPKRGCVSLAQEISVTGKRYEYIKFASPGLTCRTPTADPSCFKKTDEQIPQPRDKQKMVRVVEVCFTEEALKDFDKKLKLVPTCKFVTLFIDEGGVKLYIKGKLAQQITYCVDGTCTRHLDEHLVRKVFRPGRVAMFPASYFSMLKGFGGNFEIDIMHVQKPDGTEQMSLKGYSYVPGADPDDPILLYSAAAECSAASNGFDLIM